MGTGREVSPVASYSNQPKFRESVANLILLQYMRNVLLCFLEDMPVCLFVSSMQFLLFGSAGGGGIDVT